MSKFVIFLKFDNFSIKLFYIRQCFHKKFKIVAHFSIDDKNCNAKYKRQIHKILKRS